MMVNYSIGRQGKKFWENFGVKKNFAKIVEGGKEKKDLYT